jgi:hypothetical protein
MLALLQAKEKIHPDSFYTRFEGIVEFMGFVSHYRVAL